MTFAEWYASEVEPALLRPPGATDQQFAILRKAARASMAACWDAAIDEAVTVAENSLNPILNAPIEHQRSTFLGLIMTLKMLLTRV